MKVIKNKYFWIAVGAIALTLGILYYRKRSCESGGKKCSFWTGTPQANQTNPADGYSAVPIPGTDTGTYPVIVSKAGGAPLYAIVNNVFTPTGAKLPYETKLSATLSITSSGSWYKTNKGWLNANDIDIKNNSPH